MRGAVPALSRANFLNITVTRQVSVLNHATAHTRRRSEHE
jgi:hypothetical protein